MKITNKTKYADFEPLEQFITPEDVSNLKAAAELEYGNCYNLTIDQFWGVLSGNYELLGDLTNPTVYQYYWRKRFDEFAEEIGRACEQMTIHPTPDEEQCQIGTVKMQPMEAMLIFVRSYFGLPSFVEAGKRTMGEYMTARKDSYNKQRMQRNFEELQRKKFKKNKHK